MVSDMVANSSPLGRRVLKRIEISSDSVCDSSAIVTTMNWVPSKLTVVATAMCYNIMVVISDKYVNNSVSGNKKNADPAAGLWWKKRGHLESVIVILHGVCALFV